MLPVCLLSVSSNAQVITDKNLTETLVFCSVVSVPCPSRFFQLSGVHVNKWLWEGDSYHLVFAAWLAFTVWERTFKGDA